MLDKQGGKLIFACDSCDETFEDDDLDDNFNTVWNAAKQEGWRTRKIGSDWIHACPNCEL